MYEYCSEGNNAAGQQQRQWQHTHTQRSMGRWWGITLRFPLSLRVDNNQYLLISISSGQNNKGGGRERSRVLHAVLVRPSTTRPRVLGRMFFFFCYFPIIDIHHDKLIALSNVANHRLKMFHLYNLYQPSPFFFKPNSNLLNT